MRLINTTTTLLNLLLSPNHARSCAHGRAPLRATSLDILDNHIRSLAPQLNIIIRELAQLRIIHAVVLILLGRAQRQPWDQVHQEQNEARAAEGVGEACYGIGELVGQLDVVFVEPATGDDGSAIESCYVITVGC